MSEDECPRCGCADCELLKKVQVWGTDQKKWRCNHCGKVWTTRPGAQPSLVERTIKKVVTFFVLRCPYCHSKATRVTSTRPKGLRFHECRSCGETFQSVEDAA